MLHVEEAASTSRFDATTMTKPRIAPHNWSTGDAINGNLQDIARREKSSLNAGDKAFEAWSHS
jgi:hypothetical protein